MAGFTAQTPMADPAAALELAQSPAGRGDACFRRRTVGAPTGAPSHRTEQFHSDFDGDHEPSPTGRLEPRRRHPRELRVTGKAGVAPAGTSDLLLANLKTRRGLGDPAAVTISSELCFGMNSGAASTPTVRPGVFTRVVSAPG